MATGLTLESDAFAARGTSLRELLRRPLAATALAILLLIVLACAAAPLLAPDNPLAQNLNEITQMPSRHHLLGTDELGRDVLSRLLYGGQPALLGAAVASAVFALLGITLGLVSGYSSGVPDRVVSMAVDLLMSLPTLVLMFTVLALTANNLGAAMITLGVIASSGLIRVVRAATKATREELYVAAARVSGLSTPRILARHIAPRLVGPIVIQMSLFVGIALVVQSGLAFLNLGVVAPAPSWGGMVGEAAQIQAQFPWLLVPSGGIIGITILCLGIIGDAVRDLNADRTSREADLAHRQRRKDARHPLRRDGSESALLTVDHLTIAKRGAHGANNMLVSGISIEILAGELVGLVGESGSGKTITAQSLLGLLPPELSVSAKSVRFDGFDLTRAGEAQFRRIRGTGIGLVSQEPMIALDPSFTVGQQLSEVIRTHEAGNRAARRKRMLELLTDVRLPDPERVSARYPHELSGGMAQRVVIAMALASKPKLLIADEPTTALDVTVQAEILDLLRELRARHGMAILLVTHDLGVVADLCERVVVMRDGRVIEEQDADGLFESPSHPYTKSLIAATPSLIDLPSQTRVIDELAQPALTAEAVRD
jgi:peptide/nickel transport system permease protein